MDNEKMYKDALERAKEIKEIMYPNLSTESCKAVSEYIDAIFPELRESEDERIRKYLIEELKAAKSVGELKFIIPQPTREECIAYLEKQKEPVPIPDKFSGLKSLMLQYLQSAANRKDDTEIERDTDLWGRKILDYVWKYSDEQKEQKPLTTEETELNSIAFLEQMGYTCIPPRKEQKPAEKQDYSGLNDLERAIHRGFLTAGMDNVPVTIIKETAKECLAQMKPAEWDEEDREIAQNIMIFLKEPTTAELCPQLRKECQDWLKSLPERFNLQPKQEWSEEDKQDFDDLIMRFEKSLRINRCYFTSYDVDWLKSKFNGNSCK